jgi:peroxiredoxin
MNGRRLVLGAGAGIAAAAAGLWLGLRHFSRDEGAAPDPAVEAIFGLSLPGLSGEPVELGRFRGRTVVLNFWATWCAPCIEEMPELSAMQEDLGPRGVQVIGIGIDSDANIRRFAEKYPVSYPLLVASGSALEWMRALGNTQGGLPFTVVVDRSGTVRTRVLGRFSEPALRGVIEAASAPA